MTRIALSQLADIARGLARWGCDVDLGPADGRRGIRVLATDSYDAWVLAWPPGSNVEPHDHGSSHGVFTVVAGELTEIRWPGARIRHIRPGPVISMPLGTIHDVIGTSATPALSVHVYSPALEQMRFYDGAGSSVIGVDHVERGPDSLDAFAAALALHPSGHR